MSVESHLSELQRRHRDLDRAIESQMAMASSDDLKLTEMKRHRLKLKEQIARLQATLH